MSRYLGHRPDSIHEFLRLHGPATIRDIERLTGIPNTAIRHAMRRSLHEYVNRTRTGRGFVYSVNEKYYHQRTHCTEAMARAITQVEIETYTMPCPICKRETQYPAGLVDAFGLPPCCNLCYPTWREK